MMDCTDRHCRSFHRLLTRRTLLYTEMVTSAALLRGDWRRLLAHEPAERPLALQVGGDDPGALAACAELAEGLGFCEVNLNVGCPSDRVQAGRFGACLMREPRVVADAVAAMRARVRIPVTVKHRLGVDEQEGFEPLVEFVDTVAAAGCELFVVHARKALLAGLSPKENREVPPLRYDLVYRLKAERPRLTVVLNGGVASLDEAVAHLRHVDGVMIGRSAYHEPWLLASADTRIFGAASDPQTDRRIAAEAFLPYIERQLAAGVPLPRMTRHLVGLFHGEPRARRWRRMLTEGARGGGIDALHAALALIGAGRMRRPGDSQPGAATAAGERPASIAV